MIHIIIDGKIQFHSSADFYRFFFKQDLLGFSGVGTRMVACSKLVLHIFFYQLVVFYVVANLYAFFSLTCFEIFRSFESRSFDESEQFFLRYKNNNFATFSIILFQTLYRLFVRLARILQRVKNSHDLNNKNIPKNNSFLDQMKRTVI